MKVLFDTDPGIDDAMALLYLNACNEAEIVGITTTAGNADIDQCTRNACLLADLFSIDAPIARGSGAALNGITPKQYPDFVHGANGLGNVDLPAIERTIPTVDGAISMILELAKNYQRQLTIIAVGRLTNIAAAIQQDRTLLSGIKELIMMGGAWQCPGNVTEYAEANVIGDPEAAQIVFDAGIPVTMVGLDVTNLTRMSIDFLKDLTAGYRHADMIIQMNQYYADYYLQNDRTSDFPVHDSSAIAMAIQPSYFETVTGQLMCVTEGPERGRTLLDQNTNAPHRVCTNVNSSKFLEHYRDHVTRYLDRQ